ncbi:MAG: copper resistance protein B [Rhodospirillaceae bacterium]|jgi:copper resistance protein B|nr:copper resistance protein B [Rhodospirillaceae bacterium]MBT6218930.1 copper resistance protein B [Rhodospirillaceae bacterium]
MAFAVTFVASSPLFAEQLIWGVQAEQLEYRIGDDTDVMAWDVDALIGTDELKLVFRSEGEFETNGDVLETMENQLRLQAPISTFFDAVAGVRVDTPEGPDRVYGVVGVHGLAPQWFEIDADLFVSDRPSFRFEAEYEALITNRLILTPSVEFNLPFTDDLAIDQGAWGPKLEVGARLSYDLLDRAISPYIGVHYERVFGETQDIATSEGKDDDALFLTIGAKLIF